MAITFTIGGAAKSLQPGWRLTETLNGRNLMDFSVHSLDGTYRPALNAVVAFADGATTLYAGLVQTRRENGFGGAAASAAITNNTGAVDYNVYPEKRIVEFTIPAGSNLKAGLTILAGILNTSYSTTLHASQANGPTFAEDVVFPVGTVAAHLDKLSVMTGYGWDISYTNVLSMAAPGTLPNGSSNPAPFNLTVSGGICANVIGDIEVLPSLSTYANYIKLRYSSAATTAYAFFEMTANRVSPEPVTPETVTTGGKTYTYKDVVTGAGNVDGNVKIGATLLISLENLHRAITLQGTPGVDYAEAMTVNSQVTAAVQNATTLRVVSLQAGANGNTIACTETCANASWRTEGGAGTATLLFGADESLSLWVTATNGATPRVDAIFDHAEIQDQATAQLMADGYLVRSLAAPNEIRYRTQTSGLHPGMAQDIIVPWRNLNATCLITEVIITANGSLFSYDVTAVEALVIPAGHLDIFKKWNQTSGGGSGGSSGQSVVTMTLGLNGLINSGATAWGVGTGFWLDYNAGAPRLRIGTVAGNRFVYDETGALTVVSQNVTIDSAGVRITPSTDIPDETRGYIFGTNFGMYGQNGDGPLTLSLKLTNAENFASTISLTATSPTDVASVTVLAPYAGTSIITLTAETVKIGSTAYPATVTANQILHGTATNVIGGSSNLTWSGTQLVAAHASGTLLMDVQFADTLTTYAANDAFGGGLTFVKKRGTIASPAIVQADDLIGQIRGQAATGAATVSFAASIGFKVDGTPGVGDMPGRIEFSTTPDGSATLAERMRIDNAGHVGIGVTGPTAWLHLKAGAAAASSAPLKFTSGTNLTTAEAGAAEYNGTNLFFTRAGTVRENVLVAIDNVAAPTTTAGFAIANFYGSGAANFLGDPNRWLSVNVLGSTYKIPLYT